MWFISIEWNWQYLAGYIDQLFGVHVVKDALGVFTVTATLHDGQEELGRVVLQFQDEVHA